MGVLPLGRAVAKSGLGSLCRRIARFQKRGARGEQARVRGVKDLGGLCDADTGDGPGGLALWVRAALAQQVERQVGDATIAMHAAVV